MKLLLMFLVFILLTSLTRENLSKRYIGIDKEFTSSGDSILISWKKNIKLTWGDFQGKANEKSHFQALTSVKIGFKTKLIGEDSIAIDIACSFVKSESWTKNKNSVSLLAHEQLHFDIAELVSRNIRRECSFHKSYGLAASSKELQSIYDKYYGKYWDDLSSNYDTETNHGLIKDRQKEWEVKIAKELKALDAYSNTRVVIKRVKK